MANKRRPLLPDPSKRDPRQSSDKIPNRQPTAPPVASSTIPIMTNPGQQEQHFSGALTPQQTSIAVQQATLLASPFGSFIPMMPSSGAGIARLQQPTAPQNAAMALFSSEHGLSGNVGSSGEEEFIVTSEAPASPDDD